MQVHLLLWYLILPAMIVLFFVVFFFSETCLADKLLIGACSMLVLSVYVYTVYPNIPGGDSGKLPLEIYLN